MYVLLRYAYYRTFSCAVSLFSICESLFLLQAGSLRLQQQTTVLLQVDGATVYGRLK